MSDIGNVVKHFYPNGQLETEITYLKGPGRRWVTKHWHSNGTLNFEIHVNNGLPEDEAKYWNDKGDFIGSYEMRQGTGVQKSWYPDGSIKAEISWVNGEQTGRQRAYFDGGELASESYWIRGKKVSKKKYFEAFQKDPSLPSYEIEAASKSRSFTRKQKAYVSDSIGRAPDGGSLIQKLLSDPGAEEVLAWLKGSQSGIRTLGELNQESSVELVEEVYALGSTKVWAVEIDRSDFDAQNTGKLIVSLPKENEKRQKIFKWSAQLAEPLGFDAEVDVGQEHLFLMLD